MATLEVLLQKGVQAVLALSLTGAVIYMSIIGLMPTEIIAGLAGIAVGFYLAERKNGEERQHIERMLSLNPYQYRSKL